MDIPTQMTPGEATALFTSLPPVDVSDILGTWSGRGIATGHPLDRLLEVSGWVGKRFDGPDDVFPLIHTSVAGRISLNPGLMSLGLMRACNVAALPMVRQLFYLFCPIFRTKRPRARLRMVTRQGVTSAAMIYDQKPIIDHFRKAGEDQLMGLMDLRGDSAPFFFLLERRDSAPG